MPEAKAGTSITQAGVSLGNLLESGKLQDVASHVSTLDGSFAGGRRVRDVSIELRTDELKK
jgi:hypothetical protein